MAGRTIYFDKEHKAADVPIWREAYMGIDWLALRYSPVYYGLGVPRGDGSAVIVIPGFMATDFYLLEMYYWLKRVGYNAYLSEIGRNADCLDKLDEKLLRTVEKAYRQTGRKVNLVGHSLGGVLARSLAARYPNMVNSVITLGSPFRGIRSHPLVLQTSNVVRERILKHSRPETKECFTSGCKCDTATSLETVLPASILQTAIYTKTDGIVDWRFCITDNPTCNFEVPGTHGGLAFNPAVYRLLAQRLSLAQVHTQRPAAVASVEYIRKRA